MERTGRALLGLMLAAALLCGNAWAAGDTYALEPFGIEITAPEGDYYILHRGMDPDSPALAGMGMTAQQVDEGLEMRSAYLVAVPYDGSYELTIGVLEGEEYESLSDYERLGSQDRDAFALEVEQELERQGVTVVGNVSWYEAEEAPYMVVETGSAGVGSWSYQYHTMYHGKMIVVSAGSESLSEPTEDIREAVKRLAEGIHYTNKLPTSQSFLAALEAALPWENFTDGAAIGGMIGFTAMIVFLAVRSYRAKYGAKKAAGASTAEQDTSTGGDET